MLTRPIALRAAACLAVALALALALMGRSGQQVVAATPVYADGAGSCAGLTPCFTTIQAAVNNAGPAPAEVFVFPGTYAESVDLSDMGSAIAGSPGSITLTTVDSSGAPSPGSASIQPASGDAIGNSVSPFPGSITIDGFNVTSPDDSGIDLETASGSVTITNVTASNNLFEGVDVDTGSGNVTATNVTTNDNDDNGLDLESSSGDITVTNATANGNSLDGVSAETGGNITVSDSTANDNETAFGVTGDAGVTMTGLTAVNNDDEGIHPFSEGPVVVSESFASGIGDDGIDIETEGDVTVTNSTATLSGDNGVEIDAGGDVVIDGLSSTNNGTDEGGDGIHIDISPSEDSVDSTSITSSLLVGNSDDGIEFDYELFEAAGSYAATNNIICQNSDGGFESDTDVSIDGTGDWWGAASGPTHPNNTGGSGDTVLDGDNGFSGTVNFDPWIDTISGSAGAAVTGQPTTVSFEFTGGAGAVALTEGPGDPNGAPPFAASTDNGSVSTSGFVSGGVLQVTLTPSSVGTATVTVTGPCGLDDTLGGNSVVLNVTAAPVPTPTTAPGVTPGVIPTVTPISLPVVGAEGGTTGTEPIWLLVALGLGGVAIAGGLTLRRARR